MKTRKFYSNCSRRHCNSGCRRYTKCRRAYRLRKIARFVSPIFYLVAFVLSGIRRHKVAFTAVSMALAIATLTLSGPFTAEAPAVAYAANDIIDTETTNLVEESTISAYEIDNMGAGYVDDDLIIETTEVTPVEMFAAVEEVPVEEVIYVQDEVIDSVVVTDDMISNTATSLGAPSDYNAPVAMAGMQYLVEQEGFTVEGAAGLIGNAYTESRFDPGADNGSHFGVFQWDYWDRWPKISEYLENIGCSRTSRYDSYSGLDLNTQEAIFVCHLEAALHSSDASYYSNTIEYCKSASSASNSADRWRANYEVCDCGSYERMNIAEVSATLYYTLFK